MAKGKGATAKKVEPEENTEAAKPTKAKAAKADPAPPPAEEAAPAPSAKEVKATLAVVKSRKWPAAEVVMRAVDSLIPYTNNAMRHTDQHVQQLVNSFKEFGWTIPILVDENGMILAGHARVLAAKMAGFKEIPVMTAVGWSASDKRAYVLADNQLTREGGIDDEKLKAAIAKLADAEFDLDLLGFKPDKIAGFLDDFEPIVFSSDEVNSSAGFNQHTIRWKNRRIPIEPAEIAALNARYDAYVAEHGSSKGFVRSLFTVA